MNINDMNADSIVIFAVLVFVGGLMGFLKAKSKPSLIAGVISAALLLWCAKIVHHNSETGILLPFIFIAILEGIFIVRLIKTKKFMPGGLMLILCLFEQGFLLWNTSKLPSSRTPEYGYRTNEPKLK